MNSTLTYLGIVWEIGSYNGKACYTYAPMKVTITYHPSVGEYGVWCDKKELFSDSRIGVCLEDATLAILETLASEYRPMWEDEESAPITERTPMRPEGSMCEEVCHAAE